MQPEEAELIALQALGWVAAHEDLCPVFLGATGGSLEDLKTRVQDVALQASVLEFLTMGDDWVVAFCDAHGLAYEKPLQARYALPGSEHMHWT